VVLAAVAGVLGEEAPVDVGKKLKRPTNSILFLSKTEKNLIKEAIIQAELTTTAEIRVHFDSHQPNDVILAAKTTFEKLGMTNTKDRNGALFFICTKTHQFAVLGDQGIYQKVPQNFWDEITLLLSEHFRQNEFAEGLITAINLVGKKLATYFMASHRDINELPDEISFS